MFRLRLAVVATALCSLCLSFGLSGCNRDPNVRKQKYLESGKRYESEGKLREAVIQFSNALKVDKGFAAAHYELGKTYTKMKLPMQAYAELSKTVDLDPKNIQARIDLGNLLIAGKAPDKAKEQANAILAQQPNNADAYALLSAVAAAQGNREEAITQIQHALSIDPNRSTFHSALGVLQSEAGMDPAVAQQNLQKAIDLDKSNTSARFALAAVLEKKGDMKGAEAQLQAAIAVAPKNLQARAALASLYLHMGNKAQAEATIRKATEDFADDMDGAGMLERYYARSGQPDRAESEYASLVSEHPKSFPIRMAYARILMVNGKYDKADTVIQELAKTNGSDADVEALQASLLMQRGKNDEAFKALQQAAKNSPDNVQLKLLLGLSAQRRGDMATAETNFRDAAQREPSNLNAQRGLAEMANRKHDSSELRQVANTTMRIYPDLPDPYVWRGTADANDNHLDTAEADFKTALKLDPKNAQALTELGQLKLKQQKTAEGKALLEQAVQSDPNSRALLLLVNLDLRANQPAAAIARIQQQLTRTTPTAELYNVLAAAQLATRNPGAAADSARKALQLDPSNTTAMRNFTQAAITLGQVGPAFDMWQKWTAAHPQDAQGPAFLGMLSEASGEPTKAMEYYQKSLALKSDQPILSNNLAFLMVEAGQNLDVALSLAQNAHRALPDSPNTADTLAWVYYKKGVYASALDLLQDAAKKDPNNASIQYHLGMTYRQMNNKADAITHLKKATTLSPETSAGKSAAQELRQLS